MKHTLYTKKFLIGRLRPSATLGVDLHDGGISFAALKKSGTRYVLKTFGTIDLSADAYASGVIKDRDALSRALKAVRKKSGMRYVRASIPEEHVYVIDMTLPKSEKKKVLERVKVRLAEILPVFFDNTLINYEVLAEDATTFHLNVAVADKGFVDEYLALLGGAGFSVVSLEFRSAAIANAIVPRKNTDPVFIVSVEHFKLSIFAITGGFITTGIVSYIESPRDFHTIREKIDRAYIDLHVGVPQQVIKTIILSGVSAGEEGLADYLAVSLKMRVLLADVWTNINSFDDYIPEISKKDSLGYHAALGMALEDFEK